MALACKMFLALVVCTALVKAQRPFYAGLHPNGYPEVEQDLLANRFGDDEPSPIDVRGDKGFVNRLQAMPIDKRPFWYLNWKAYEAARKQPQTYPQRPNSFIDTSIKS